MKTGSQLPTKRLALVLEVLLEPPSSIRFIWICPEKLACFVLCQQQQVGNVTLNDPSGSHVSILLPLKLTSITNQSRNSQEVSESCLARLPRQQYSLSGSGTSMETSAILAQTCTLGPHMLLPGPFFADFVKTERDESSGPKCLKSLTSHDPMKQWEPASR